VRYVQRTAVAREAVAVSNCKVTHEFITYGDERRQQVPPPHLLTSMSRFSLFSPRLVDIAPTDSFGAREDDADEIYARRLRSVGGGSATSQDP
jgi:hypothetical protein